MLEIFALYWQVGKPVTIRTYKSSSTDHDKEAAAYRQERTGERTALPTYDKQGRRPQKRTALAYSGTTQRTNGARLIALSIQPQLSKP